MKTRKHTKLFIWQQKCKSDTEVCSKCGEKRHLTVDHIVPVNILEQFMLEREEVLYNLEENFQILCRYCNLMKGGRIDPRNPKTYSIILGVLDRSRNYFIIK